MSGCIVPSTYVCMYKYTPKTIWSLAEAREDRVDVCSVVSIKVKVLTRRPPFKPLFTWLRGARHQKPGLDELDILLANTQFNPPLIALQHNLSGGVNSLFT